MFARLRFGGFGRTSAVRQEEVTEASVGGQTLAVLEPPPFATALADPAPKPKRPVTPRIKTYQVAEVRQAMTAARRELGDEAILIQTKRLDRPSGDLKYEVTFGIAGDGAPVEPVPAIQPVIAKKPVEAAIKPAPVARPGLAKREVEAPKSLTEEFDRIRAELTALHELVSSNYWQVQSTQPASRTAARTAQLRQQFAQHNIDSDLASEWLLAVEDRLASDPAAGDEDATASMLAEQLSARIRVDSSLGWDSSQGQSFMLVGPAGSGKTTALLKLALEYGIKRGRPVDFWTLDPLGRELDQTTQSFTQVLNIPSRSFKSSHTLIAALEGVNLQERLVLIDTKGFGTQSIDADREVSALIDGSVPIDTQLVLPATWHASALSSAVDRFEVFQPSRLMFTMLDQARTFGALLQEPWRTRKPLSFLGEGVLGSGKIQPASLSSILHKIDQIAG